MKRKVAIVTDSTAYLSEDLLEEFDIQVIPLIVNWEGESFLDGIDILPDAFYSRLQTAKEMPTTSQPSGLSGTMDSARAAVKELSDLSIELVDSESAAMGLALMVLYAARMAVEGKDYQEIAEKTRILVPKTRMLFVVDTLEFLHIGGRIGGAQRLVGSVLSIKPILHLLDGKIESLASVRTKRKAVAHLMDIVGKDTGWGSQAHYGVLDAMAPDTADKMYNEIKDHGEPAELLRGGISPVIGTHIGPGAVGIAYYDAADLG